MLKSATETDIKYQNGYVHDFYISRVITPLIHLTNRQNSSFCQTLVFRTLLHFHMQVYEPRKATLVSGMLGIYSPEGVRGKGCFSNASVVLPYVSASREAET